MPIHDLHTIDYIEARDLAAAVRDEVSSDGGLPVATAVLDAFGGILIIERPNSSVKAMSADNAIRKAKTVLEFLRATAKFRFKQNVNGEWLPAGGDGWSELDIAIALARDSNFCPWAGGIPLIREIEGGRCLLGALAVSNRDELEDHDLVARAAHSRGYIIDGF